MGFFFIIGCFLPFPVVQRLYDIEWDAPEKKHKTKKAIIGRSQLAIFSWTDRIYIEKNWFKGTFQHYMKAEHW